MSSSSSSMSSCSLGRTGKNENPLYRTSNQSYGCKNPSALNKPPCENNRKGSFTKQLGNCMSKSSSLNCSMTKSKALPNPSFGVNSFVSH